jgi:hypothetical protein
MKPELKTKTGKSGKFLAISYLYHQAEEGKAKY